MNSPLRRSSVLFHFGEKMTEGVGEAYRFRDTFKQLVEVVRKTDGSAFAEAHAARNEIKLKDAAKVFEAKPGIWGFSVDLKEGAIFLSKLYKRCGPVCFDRGRAEKKREFVEITCIGISMTKTKLILIVLGIISFFYHDAIGQVSKKPSGTKSKSASISRRQFNHNQKISTSYDRFDNRSMITLDLILKELVGLDQTSLSVSYPFDGKTMPIKVGDVLLNVTRFFGRPSDYERFAYRDTLILLLDGKPSKIPMETERSIGLGSSDRGTAWISYSQLRQIANARNIEGRIGDIEFTLTDNYIEALRDFASRLSR